MNMTPKRKPKIQTLVLIKCPNCNKILTCLSKSFTTEMYASVIPYRYSTSDSPENNESNPENNESENEDYDTDRISISGEFNIRDDYDWEFISYTCPACGYDFGNDLYELVKHHAIMEIPIDKARELFENIIVDEDDDINEDAKCAFEASEIQKRLITNKRDDEDADRT